MAKQAFFGIHRRSPKLVFFASLLSRSRRREESSSPPALGEMSSRYSVCRHVDPCRLLLQDVDGGQAIVHLLTGEMCMLLAVEVRWVLRYDEDGFGYVRAGEKCKWADDLLKLTLCHDGAEDNEGKLYVFRQVEGGVPLRRSSISYQRAPTQRSCRCPYTRSAASKCIPGSSCASGEGTASCGICCGFTAR